MFDFYLFVFSLQAMAVFITALVGVPVLESYQTCLALLL